MDDERHSIQAQRAATTIPGGGATTRVAVVVGGDGGRGGKSTFLKRIQEHAQNSTQVVGFLTLVITGGILLLLSGLTLTATVMGLIFFSPLIILSSPIWVPAGTVLFVAIGGVLSMSGFGLSFLAGLSWIYKYYIAGKKPQGGSVRVDYGRSRIADTASHMKEYAKEYGEYWRSKIKDAAPSA